MPESDAEKIIDNAAHAVKDTLPESVISRMNSCELTDLLYLLNDALQAVLQPVLAQD